jgi:hypothetical protein
MPLIAIFAIVSMLIEQRHMFEAVIGALKLVQFYYLLIA